MKYRLACLILALTLAPAAISAAEPQTDPAKQADIRRLLELTEMTKQARSTAEGLSEQIKDMLVRNLPPGERSQRIVDTFLRKMAERAQPKDLVDMMVPIYDKHLTREDVRGLIQFYESPLGRRVALAMPQIAQEGYTAGAQWGQKIAEDVFKEMQKDYPELGKSPLE